MKKIVLVISILLLLFGFSPEQFVERATTTRDIIYDVMDTIDSNTNTNTIFQKKVDLSWSTHYTVQTLKQTRKQADKHTHTQLRCDKIAVENAAVTESAKKARN